MNYILKIIAIVTIILISIFVTDNDIGTNLIADAIIIGISFIIFEFLNDLIKHRKHLKKFIQCKIFLRNTEVRLSIAYLFKINIDGKYLLVKSRIKNAFQPVGGAFKTLPGSEKLFSKLGVRLDRLIETEHGIAKGDLRVHVKGKHVMEFLDWFHTREDRETSPWREFCEELISTEILPWRPFRYIDYKFKGMIQSPIITLDSGGKGLFLFEIYDLVVNDEQKPVLQELIRNGNTDQYIWVEDYLIQRLGHDERTKVQIHEILPHVKYAQNMKWSTE